MEITALDQTLGRALASMEGVVAVGIGGSRASGFADASSDTDMYAFYRGDAPAVEARQEALGPIADGAVGASEAFGPEDHLTVAGSEVEVIYLSLDEVAQTVDQAYEPGLMNDGFTTAFLYTVAHCVVLADNGELADLQQRLRTFPEATRRRILDESPALLAAFLDQLAKAQQRGDLAMVTHRRASIQATWFNILFALNRRYHPGEKRLLEHTQRLAHRPEDLGARWAAAQLTPADDADLLRQLSSLTQELLAMATD